MGGIEQVVIVLPLPNRSQHQNWRGHWAVRAKATKRSRNLALLKAEEARTTGWAMAVVDYHFYHKDSRRRDAVNFAAACKAYLDGIVESGLIPDDDAGHLRVGEITFAVDKKTPRVELVFTRVNLV